jgi:beta-lactamase class A
VVSRGQRRDDRDPQAPEAQRGSSGLPAGIDVAHKRARSRIHHDAGVVYAKRPYVLVVLVRGIDDQAASGRLIAEISRIVYSVQ